MKGHVLIIIIIIVLCYSWTLILLWSMMCAYSIGRARSNKLYYYTITIGTIRFQPRWKMNKYKIRYFCVPEFMGKSICRCTTLCELIRRDEQSNRGESEALGIFLTVVQTTLPDIIISKNHLKIFVEISWVFFEYIIYTHNIHINLCMIFVLFIFMYNIIDRFNKRLFRFSI